MATGLLACTPAVPAENEQHFRAFGRLETYDFSTGTCDVSARVGFSDGVQTLHLQGLPPDQPRRQTDQIFISGAFWARASREPWRR
jgi:hypothetical protein